MLKGLRGVAGRLRSMIARAGGGVRRLGELPVVRNYVLKDLSRETSMESFVQTVTIILSILAVWFVVASRTAVGAMHELVGTPYFLFDYPSIYDTVLGMYDVVSMLVQNFSASEMDTGIREYAAEAMGSDPATVSVTLLGFSCRSMTCVFWKTPLVLLGLLLLSLGTLARFRTMLAIPLIALFVGVGVGEVGKTVREGVLGGMYAALRANFVNPDRAVDAVRDVTRHGRMMAEGEGQVLRRQLLARDLEVVPNGQNPLAFEVSREVDGQVRSEQGILLFCLQQRCPYLPLTSLVVDNMLKSDSVGGLSIGAALLTIWNVDRGIAILRLDDPAQRITLLGTKSLADTVSTPHALAITHPDLWRQYQAAREKSAAVTAPQPVTALRQRVPIGTEQVAPVDRP